MTRVFFSVKDGDVDPWQAAFAKAGLDLVRDDAPAPGVRYGVTWKPRDGAFAHAPDLAVLFALGAGIEHLLGNPALPPGVAVVKMAEPVLTETMTQYVVWQVIHHHRKFWELAEAQRAARWFAQTYPPPWQRKVGIMGLGTLGTEAAKALRDFHFDLRGWSRSRKAIDGVVCFAGAEELNAFLDGLDILVCLLPLTPETTGILNADLFSRLAPAAALINVGRGAQLNESDLLAALASGQLAAATLDVMSVEPLPAGHPFWRHKRIFITPHNAADVGMESAAAAIARQIARAEAGEALEHVAERERGY